MIWRYRIKRSPSIWRRRRGAFPMSLPPKFMGGRLTYRELNHLAGCFAAVLAGMGIGRGSRVALNLPNCPQFMIAYSGILKAGAVVVPCNPLYVNGS
jgi:long-chain acyl-CoA synthetase